MTFDSNFVGSGTTENVISSSYSYKTRLHTRATNICLHNWENGTYRCFMNTRFLNLIDYCSRGKVGIKVVLDLKSEYDDILSVITVCIIVSYWQGLTYT